LGVSFATNAGKMDTLQVEVSDSVDQEDQASPFDEIPDETLIHIFSFVKTAQDAAHVSQVSRRFYRVMSDVNEVRLVVKGALNALGDILKNVRPETALMSTFVEQMLAVIEPADAETLSWRMERARSMIGRFLHESKKYPESVRNHLIQTFLKLVKEKGNEETFLFCLKTIYAASPVAQKLYLARSANHEPRSPFREFSQTIAELNPTVSESPEGIQIDPESSFQRSVVRGIIRSYLSISPDHTFKEGEIVAISHTGRLTPGRRQLMYGVVKAVVQKGEKPVKYRVYTHLYDSGEKKTWIDDALLESHMIGKIQKNPATAYELGKKFKVSN